MVTAAAEVVTAGVTSGAAKNRLGRVDSRGDERPPTGGSSSSRSCRSRGSCGRSCSLPRGRGTRRGKTNKAGVVDFESETFAHFIHVHVVRGLNGVDVVVCLAECKERRK